MRTGSFHAYECFLAIIIITIIVIIVIIITIIIITTSRWWRRKSRSFPPQSALLLCLCLFCPTTTEGNFFDEVRFMLRGHYSLSRPNPSRTDNYQSPLPPPAVVYFFKMVYKKKAKFWHVLPSLAVYFVANLHTFCRTFYSHRYCGGVRKMTIIRYATSWK